MSLGRRKNFRFIEVKSSHFTVNDQYRFAPGGGARSTIGAFKRFLGSCVSRFAITS
jgi:hypothetical protein